MILDYTDDAGRLIEETYGREVREEFLSDNGVLVKTASPFAEDYALHARIDGRVVRKYPVHTADDVVVSALYFSKHAHQLTPRQRREAGEAIQEAAAAFGLQVGEIQKEASAMTDASFYSQVAGSPRHTAQEALDRMFAERTPFEREKLAGHLVRLGRGGAISEKYAAYKKGAYGADVEAGLVTRKSLVDEEGKEVLAAMVRNASKVHPSVMLQKLAYFDRKYYLGRHYESGRILDPHQTVYGTLSKTAEAFVEVGGESIRADEISSYITSHGADLSARFGDVFAEGLQKHPVETFSSLPTPHKQTIVGMMNGDEE